MIDPAAIASKEGVVAVIAFSLAGALVWLVKNILGERATAAKAERERLAAAELRRDEAAERREVAHREISKQFAATMASNTSVMVDLTGAIKDLSASHATLSGKVDYIVDRMDETAVTQPVETENETPVQRPRLVGGYRPPRPGQKED